MQLSRPTILDAALEILDSYGLADTTMRRIAKQLGVAPGALYWHFPHKQALLSGIARQLLSPVLGEEPACTSPHARTAAPVLPHDSAVDNTVATCAHVRLCMLAVTDGADVVAAALADDEMRQRLVDRVVADVSPVCGPSTPAPDVAAALIDFVVGSTVGEQSRARLAQFAPTSQGEQPAVPESLVDQVYSDDGAGDVLAQPGARAVEWGVRLLLAGVQAHQAAPST